MPSGTFTGLYPLPSKLLDGFLATQHGNVTGDLHECLLPVLPLSLLILIRVPVARLKRVGVEAELPRRLVRVQQMIEKDRQHFLVGVRQRPATMMPHVPVGRLASFVDGQIVEVVVEQALRVARLKLPHPHATTINHRRLTVAKIAIGFGQDRLVERLRLGEMEEPLAQIVEEPQHVRRQRNEDPRVIPLGPHLFVIDDLDLDGSPVAMFTNAAVDGVGNELPQGQSDFVPILLAVVEDEAQVFGAGSVRSGRRIAAAVLHANTSEFLAGLSVGDGLRLREKLQLERAAKHDRGDVISEADGHAVLVAAAELADDALPFGGVGKADAQHGEAFGRADADVFDLEISGHWGIPAFEVVERSENPRHTSAFHCRRRKILHHCDASAAPLPLMLRRNDMDFQ